MDGTTFGGFESETQPEQKVAKTMEDNFGKDGRLEVDLVDEWTPDVDKLHAELGKSAI